MSTPDANPPPAAPSGTRAPVKKKLRVGAVLIPVAALVVGCLGGPALGGSDDGSATASAPAPTVTVTADADAAPAPATTKTVTAPAPEPSTVTATPDAPAAAAGSITDDGTLVGDDIEPGRYRSDGGPSCYWARLNDLDGGLGSIAANDLGSGQKIVQISESDAAFETRGCGWTRS